MLHVHVRAEAATLAVLVALERPISAEKLAEKINYSTIHTKRIIDILRREGLIVSRKIPGCRALAHDVNLVEAIERGLL